MDDKLTFKEIEETINNSCMAMSMSILDKETRHKMINNLAKIQEMLEVFMKIE